MDIIYVWKPALKKVGLEPRSLSQTRQAFATLMLDAGEHPGWVQKMIGHETLQMIYEKYYSYIKKIFDSYVGVHSTFASWNCVRT